MNKSSSIDYINMPLERQFPKSPKITIIMPCYNCADFIYRSIESVLNQTYLNWELLCINDMSTDNTLDILNQYAQKDKRIKVFNRKKRIGKAAPNCNYALEKATGYFICRLDPDDDISTDYLEKLIKRQQETNADIVIPDCCFVYPSNSNKNWTMAGILKRWGKTNKKINRDIILTGRQACELSLNWRILLKSSGLNADRAYLLSIAGKVLMKIKLKLTRPRYE